MTLTSSIRKGMTKSKRHSNQMKMNSGDERIWACQYRLIYGFKFDLGGSDLATSQMEEINPNLDTGYLPHPAAATPAPAIRPVPE